jgi:hypothetical protein
VDEHGRDAGTYGDVLDEVVRQRMEIPVVLGRAA